jgi:hypothetical protein
MSQTHLSQLFAGRKLLIATKHEKEKVIAPILERELGVKCFVSDIFDTDTLGTFTGEVARLDDPVTTVRNKCRMAMELNDCDLAVASEGSFVPHPFMFFVHADDEMLLLLDQKNNLEIMVRELATETNFNGREIKTAQELADFAAAANFPAHGLIARKAKDDTTEIIKGITDWQKLSEVFAYFTGKYNSLFVETDMRAMFNPTRMKVIETATHKLVDKIKSICPQCNTPGFGITDRKEGLPCSLCGFPTQSTLCYLYTCQHCGFLKDEMYPNHKTAEDPGCCALCNP